MSPDGASAVARILRAAGWTAAMLAERPEMAGMVARVAAGQGAGPALRMAVNARASGGG